MNLPVALARALRDAGHDAVHLFERRQARLPDTDIFMLAGSEGRIAVTCDPDFGALIALSHGQSVSAIVIRGRDLRAARLLHRLSKLLPAIETDLEAGAVVVVEPGRHRTRRLPIGG